MTPAITPPPCPFVSGFSDDTGSWELNVGEWSLRSETPLLFYLERGEMSLRLYDGEVTLSARSALLLPAGSPLSATVKAAGSALVIGFTSPQSASIPHPLVFARVPLSIGKTFLHFWGAFRTREVGWDYACLSDLYAILYGLFRNSPDGNRRYLQTELIRPSVSYLERHATDRRLNMEEVAALSGVSETHFRSLFVKQFGCTPLQYVHQHRIQTVEQALACGAPLSEAITLGGFCDRAHFLRIYQRVKGKPFSVQ